MKLFNYSKTGFYLKLATGILAFLWIPLAIYDGFWANRLDASSKGANLFAALFYLFYGVIILISAWKEKRNLQPMKGCLYAGFIGCSFLGATFWIAMSLWVLVTSEQSDNSFYYSVFAVICFFITITSLRELFIGKIFKNQND